MPSKQNTRHGPADGAQGEEREWIKQAVDGDQQAFCRLAERYSKRIYNIGLKMLGNAEDASDMAQEALIKIYRHLPGFRGDCAFSTWVYRISVNTCRDVLRASYRNHEQAFSDFGDEDSLREPEIADFSALPENLFVESEQQQYLYALIAGLSPKYRIVFVLREISNLSYQEIAASVNISVGTVKSRLNRARAVMRNRIIADAEHYPHLGRLIGKGGEDDEMHGN